MATGTLKRRAIPIKVSPACTIYVACGPDRLMAGVAVRRGSTVGDPVARTVADGRAVGDADALSATVAVADGPGVGVATITRTGTGVLAAFGAAVGMGCANVVLERGLCDAARAGGVATTWPCNEAASVWTRLWSGKTQANETRPAVRRRPVQEAKTRATAMKKKRKRTGHPASLPGRARRHSCAGVRLSAPVRRMLRPPFLAQLPAPADALLILPSEAMSRILEQKFGTYVPIQTPIARWGWRG